MGLETANFISQLVPANPVGGVDNYSTADDHLRMLKTVLQTQFPNLGAAAVTPTAAQINFLVGVTSAVQTQLDAKEILANKNAANGYAGLDSGGQLADARVKASNVTQHQGSLALAGSQITSGTVSVSRLGSGTPGSTNYLRGDGAWSQIAASEVLSGTFADARVAQSNVTQHQAALAIACSQLTGNMPDARIVASNVTQHQGSLAIAASQTTSGTFADARIAQSNVTQHQAALALNMDQMTTQIQTKTSSFSVDSTMDEDIVICDSASTITVTVGSNCLGGAGVSAGYIRRNTGAVTFSASGVTIRTPAGLSISAQHGKACLTQIDSTNFELSGNL